MLIGETLKSQGGFQDGKKFAKALLKTTVAGPRGNIQYDADTMRAGAEVWLRKVQEQDDEWVNVPSKVLGNANEAQSNLMVDPTALTSGWVNPYLCV